MIAYLGEWIKHIVLLILIATFLDMLLPSNTMRRYVKMVVGLLIIMVILSPVLDLLQFDHERMLSSVDELFGDERDDLKQDIEDQQGQVEAAQEEAIQREVENQWAQEMKEQIEASFPVNIHELAVQLEQNRGQVDVKHVALDLSRREEQQPTESKAHVEEHGREGDPAERESHPEQGRENELIETVRPVEPVDIQVDPGPTDEREAKLTFTEKKLQDKVLTYLEDEWNITVDKISFSWTGR